MIPTPVVRHRETDPPCIARKVIKAGPFLARAQPRVKAVYKPVPVKKVIRRPRISAMVPTNRRVQPHVSLQYIFSHISSLKTCGKYGFLRIDRRRPQHECQQKESIHPTNKTRYSRTFEEVRWIGMERPKWSFTYHRNNSTLNPTLLAMVGSATVRIPEHIVFRKLTPATVTKTTTVLRFDSIPALSLLSIKSLVPLNSSDLGCKFCNSVGILPAGGCSGRVPSSVRLSELSGSELSGKIVFVALIAAIPMRTTVMFVCSTMRQGVYRKSKMLEVVEPLVRVVVW